AFVHVTVPTLQVQPLPAMATAANDAGSASETVTVPLVAAPPTFLTLMVNVSAPSPCVKGSAWLLEMARSGAGKHGLGVDVPYCAAFPKSFVVVPEISLPKLKRHEGPVPACE